MKASAECTVGRKVGVGESLIANKMRSEIRGQKAGIPRRGSTEGVLPPYSGRFRLKIEVNGTHK